MATSPKDKRFCIRTFRGYECADTIIEAHNLALDMIEGVMKDGWCEEYWWCHLIDNVTNSEKIYSCNEDGIHRWTPWLYLR